MGPLTGVKVLEFAGIGPGPMCAMLLADMGATVLRLDRTKPSGLGTPRPLNYNLLFRNRPAVAVDLKDPAGVELALRLVEEADAIVEGFRPGVMERLGLGPDVCIARNPKLVYGRMTGWGQEGPMAMAAAHDLNYIALTGVLHAIGRRGQPPTPPLNLVGDFGGGALYLAMGILAAMLEARSSGKGQVVDAAIVDGAASLMTSFYGMHAGGIVTDDRGTNANDTGAHFYEVYECADGKWISIACIEPKFHEELMRLIGIDPEGLPPQRAPTTWPVMKERLGAIFKTRTRDQWSELLEGTDACYAPVLSGAEAPHHAHMKARETFIEIDGVIQPAPAPRFSRTPNGRPKAPQSPAQTDAVATLKDWLPAAEVDKLKAAGTI